MLSALPGTSDRGIRHPFWREVPATESKRCDPGRASGTVAAIVLSRARVRLHPLFARNRGTSMLKPIAFIVAITALAASLAACISEQQQAKLFVSVTANKFDLSDQQKARLFDVAMDALNFRTEMTQDSQELKQEILAMLSADTLDTARINQVLDQKERIFRKYSRLLVADFAELHRTLTAEQKQKLIDTLKKRDARSALRAASEAGCQTGVQPEASANGTS